jgi:hypothetical protein
LRTLEQVNVDVYQSSGTHNLLRFFAVGLEGEGANTTGPVPPHGNSSEVAIPTGT